MIKVKMNFIRVKVFSKDK